MEMLKTSFAGLTLKNPLIVSSCGLTNNADNNARLAQAGAAAIVLKSVFEEQIVRESQHLAQTDAHTEEADYMQRLSNKANNAATYPSLPASTATRRVIGNTLPVPSKRPAPTHWSSTS